MRTHHPTPPPTTQTRPTTSPDTYHPVPVGGGTNPPRRGIPAELLDRPGSQGRRGQEFPGTPLVLRERFEVTENNDAMVLGIVDRPLTAARPVEPPSARNARYPIVSLTFTLVGQAGIGAVAATGQLPATVGATATTAFLACALVLIIAECVHNATHR